MRCLLQAARPAGAAQGAAKERGHAAMSALTAGMSEEAAAKTASLPPAMNTVLAEALEKGERTLQKRTHGRRVLTA